MALARGSGMTVLVLGRLLSRTRPTASATCAAAWASCRAPSKSTARAIRLRHTGGTVGGGGKVSEGWKCDGPLCYSETKNRTFVWWLDRAGERTRCAGWVLV